MQILLRDGKWFPVANIGSPSLDGRIIKEKYAQEILNNFRDTEFVPYIAIGHDGAFGSGNEARVGSIKDIRISETEKGKVLEVLPHNLDKDFIQTLQKGSYPHVSVEIGFRTEREEGKEEPNLTAFLYGFAVLGRKAPAFPNFRTVAFSQTAESQIYLFKNGGNNMPTFESKQETTSDTTTTITGEKLQDKEEQTFEQLKDKYNTIEKEKKFLESKIEEYNKETQNYKEKVEEYELKVAKLEFKNFYNKHVQRGVLLNKDLKFKTEDTSNIFDTEMFEHWKKLDDKGRQELDEHYNFKTSIVKDQPSFAKTELRPEAQNKSKDDLIFEKMEELAKSDNTRLTIGNTGNYSYYLQQATKIIERDWR